MRILCQLSAVVAFSYGFALVQLHSVLLCRLGNLAEYTVRTSFSLYSVHSVGACHFYIRHYSFSVILKPHHSAAALLHKPVYTIASKAIADILDHLLEEIEEIASPADCCEILKMQDI